VTQQLLQAVTAAALQHLPHLPHCSTCANADMATAWCPYYCDQLMDSMFVLLQCQGRRIPAHNALITSTACLFQAER
jgi:hypothetical protein